MKLRLGCVALTKQCYYAEFVMVCKRVTVALMKGDFFSLLFVVSFSESKFNEGRQKTTTTQHNTTRAKRSLLAFFVFVFSTFVLFY
jgi:hypothetical protein